MDTHEYHLVLRLRGDTDACDAAVEAALDAGALQDALADDDVEVISLVQQYDTAPAAESNDALNEALADIEPDE